MTAQGAGAERLRSETQDLLKRVATYLETLRLGASGAAAGQSADAANLRLRVVVLESRVDAAL